MVLTVFWKIDSQRYLNWSSVVGKWSKKRKQEKTYINDDTSWPHVKASVVAFVPKDLRRQVGWSPYDAFPEPFLPNNPRKAKVT